MMKRFRIWALATVAVGLLGGPAAWAQQDDNIVQADRVLYAVSLLDATTNENVTTADGQLATGDSDRVRVKVTLSIPRTGTTYGMPTYARPSRLMFRPHKGPETAFDGSILLTRDAPYDTNGASASGFYPMPQTGDTHYDLVESGDPTPSYVAPADQTSTVNPARWECTYLSVNTYDLNAVDDPVNPFIVSLMNGQSTYEWYVAGTYGIGSFTRVSDIQDAGRKQTFTDPRVWTPHEGDDMDSEGVAFDWANGLQPGTLNRWGSIYRWTLGVMPGDTTWEIHGGVIGDTANGVGGVQLLGMPGTAAADHSGDPRLVSPIYPDGISSISFDAALATEMADQTLRVEVQPSGGTWTLVGEGEDSPAGVITPTVNLRSYTVAIPADLGTANCRFRIVRDTSYQGGSQDQFVITIKNLIVRSASPSASFDAAPVVSPDPLYAPTGGTWTLTLKAEGTGDATNVPRGYEADIQLRRRANGDTTAQWYSAANVSVSRPNATTGASNLTATFSPVTLTTGNDGSTNVTENAFALSNSRITGALPGVYDVKLNYGILGSFLAGRDIIDQRESVTGEISVYTVQVENPDYDPADPNSEEFLTEYHPMVADLREQETAREGVTLRLFYRSGDEGSYYSFLTLDVPMLPDAHNPKLWRADLSRVLREATESNGSRDTTAVYVWAPNELFEPPADGATGHRETGTEGYLAFRVFATAPDGTVNWLGTGTGNTSMPTPLNAVPATSSTLVTTASEEATAPVVTPLDIPNSHISVAIDFSASDTEPAISLVGSYCQDFNTWYAAAGSDNDGFGDSDFREDVNRCTANFNVRTWGTNDTTGDRTIVAGWIPDEGPFAETSAFTDSFAVARTQTQSESSIYKYFYNNTADRASGNNFRQWGASSDAAGYRYLQLDKQVTAWSRYFELSGGTEVVLRRDASCLGDGTWMPNAMVRLTPGDEMSPNTNANLNGIGTVTISYSLSMPYNMNYRAKLSGADGLLSGYGLAAGIDTSGFTTSCAPSGVSVSYYLESASITYELRLTQIWDFTTSVDTKPQERVVVEMYSWNGGRAERLALNPITGETGTIYSRFVTDVNTLAGNSFAFWVDANGYLRAGRLSSANNSGTYNSTFARSNATVTVPQDGFTFAIGTAECAPTFRYLRTTASRSDTFSGNGIGTNVTIKQPSVPTWGVGWSVNEETSGGTIRLSRNKPSVTQGGQLRLDLTQQGATIDGGRTLQAPTFGTMTTSTVTLGRANADFTISCIYPEGANEANDISGIFVDDITVSSWCGDDTNRNGETHVPVNTNAGFGGEDAAGEGFSAVGVWVRPRDDAELDVNQWSYSGEQVLLMQRSRQNTKFGEVTVNGTRTTGASLALYFPWSNGGYGPVTFDYCIPPRAGVPGEPVTLMLQYSTFADRTTNFLENTNDATSGWENASDPITLDDVSGAWSSVSVIPRIDGEEIVGGEGTLRLVMVIPDAQRDNLNYDPYVYIDNVVVTDNRAGVLASWTAGNARLTSTPVDLLYWKDRQAAENLTTEAGDTLTQDTFAEKAALTTAFQFNNTTTEQLTDSYIDSPLLDAGVGVGRVSFAARLSAQNAKPVRLYISGTKEAEKAAESLAADDFSILTYVDIENTVYTAFDLDLSKITFLEGDFTYRDIRRLRLWVAPNGLAPADYTGGYDRVLIDRLSISDPVSPNLRITDVAFSNVAGNKLPEEFVSTSPLSQPVSGAPVLRVCATVGNRQLVKDDTVRVFFTYITTEASTLRDTSNSYTDVFNNSFTGSPDSPIYRWKGSAEEWAISFWFNTAANPIDPAVVGPDADWEESYPTNTIELELGDDPNDRERFYGDLSEEGIAGLPENSLVRYVVWAVYQGDQLDAEGNPTDEWFMSVISASDYKEPAWYFPRSLNKEIRDAHNAANEDNEEAQVGTECFSPYFWMYSCVPGEVFLNELNFTDNSTNPLLSAFAEICVPVGIDLSAWRFASTGFGNNGITELSGIYAVPTTYNENNLDAPDNGVVPAKRVANTSASRTFYTIHDSSFAPTYRTADGGTLTANGVNYRNAGWDAQTSVADQVFATGSSNTVTSALLYRPTGGAEHIVIFSNALANSASSTTLRGALIRLRDAYYNAYSANGFAVDSATEGTDSDTGLAIQSPWYQTFLDTTWEQEKANFADDRISALAHASRLTVADTFYAVNGRYNATDVAALPTWVYERDADAARSVSIATLDMGGKWVSRRNDVTGAGVNGPGDLTHILTGNWPSDFNPTEKTRPAEPEDTDDNSIELDTDAVAPVVQVTPRQVNPDQYILQYSGLTQCGVISEIFGAGTHTLYLPQKANATETRRGGNERVSWSVDASGHPTATLTYDALPFHHLTGLKVRMLDSASGKYLSEDPRELEDGSRLPAFGSQVTLPGGVSLTFPADPNDWITVGNLPADTTTFDIAATLYNLAAPDDTETRYLFEAQATFKFDSTDPDARALITGVRPCTALPEETADGSAPTVSARRNQPWRGSGFGFEADYDADLLEQRNLSLEAVLVFYPDPGHRADWGLNAAWVGANYTDPNYTNPDDPTAPAPVLSLEGLSFADATEQISTILTPDYGTRVAQLNPNDGRFADASRVGILGNAYSDIDGNGAIEGTEQIEPAIPYVAWGVYRATFQTDSGSGSVDFLVRQAMPGEASSSGVTPFVYPSWYAPTPDLNATGDAAMPYFYLYSTPPESAWINEVNIANPAGDSTSIAAEVVMPVLRDGITAAGVPQTTPDGWAVRTYDSAGAQAGTASLEPTVDAESAPQSGSSSYAYYTATLTASNDLRAYVLHRPCGAAEGGVWLSADASGNTAVNGPTFDPANWLSPGGSGNVFNGVTDSTDTAGSVQLVGQLVENGADVAPSRRGISSVAAERNQWAFRTATLGEDNLDENGNPIWPDSDPEWNQVAFTIALRNATYGSGLCGTWINGYFSSENVTGRTETTTVTASGQDWVYAELNNGNVFSFKPRTGYCFDSIALPPDLIGHVMLIGASGGVLTEDVVLSTYNRYIQARDNADNPATVTTGTWLTLGGRATVDEATGVITFNRDYDEDGADGDETFADQDDFVITLLFVDEPASATNAITVSFAQGETGAGAWLATQTFFAIDEDGTPISEKGGETIDFPIWDDAEGNARGEHKDVHGWLYQPLVGDKLGMSVVLDPSRGLVGSGRNGLGDAQAVCYDLAEGNTQLYLVWSLIPASTVSAADPTGSQASQANTDFYNQWSLTSWLGATPSIGTGLTTSLSTIRQNLARKYDPTGTQSYCIDAGVVPLEFIGFRDPDLIVSEDAANGGILETDPDYTDEDFLANARLAFRTMTAEHFAAGGFDQSGFADGLAPFTQTIDMTDETVWQNGAVLRFAIVVARDDTVYDAQGIANFTSDGFEGYCPWYVPDDQANINAHAIKREAGVSPYAWIYGIAPDGVWLNEFRPTRRNANGKDLLSFGIELAMESSPIAVMTGAEGETPTYEDPVTITLPGDNNSYYLRPKHSLDGWSIAVKVAPLPLTTDPLDVPLAWTNVTTNIELKGWVPNRRLFPNAADPAVYDTDYYVIGDTRIGPNYPHGFFQNISSSETPNFISYPYVESNKNGFCWYPAQDPLALANIPEAARTCTEVYKNGTLYAIQLVRDNGVVADEVLLCDYRADASVSIVEACLQHAVTIENASHTVSTVVRSMPVSRLSDTVESAEVAYSNMLVACIDHTDANNPRDLGTSWSYDSSSTHRNTFFGANGGWWLGNWELVQPRTAFRLSASDAGRILALSAQIVGGGTSGLLSLVHNGTDSATGRAVSFVGAPGDSYALSVAQPWNKEWFRLSSITKNGQPLEAQAKRLTTFSVADAGTLSADASFAIDSGLLERDTDYVLTLVYSPAAARLDASGALESEDDGFLEWVLQNDPDAILKQTQEDGVTASEKYWLGFDSAIEVADVNLNFTGIGTYAEGDEALAAAEGTEPLEGAEGVKTVPTVSIAFTNKGEPITEIRGDGALLLLGKVSLDDPEWRYVKRLYPNDLNGDRVLILSDTDCNFFRAVLLSVKDAEATGR